MTYQWYRVYSNTAENGEAIANAKNAGYTPTLADLNAYLYCVVTFGEKTVTAGAVPVFANDKTVNTPLIGGSETAGADKDWLVAEILLGGALTYDMITPTGKFYVEYDMEAAPELCLSNANDKWHQAKPTLTGVTASGKYYAEYSYDACADAWGTTDFSELKRIYIKDVDEKGITVNSFEWRGGDLGKDIITGNALSFDFNDNKAGGWVYEQNV